MLPAADTLNFFRNEFQDCPEFSRPNILDVTLRDGGFTNNFSFSRKEIISHYNLLSGIGVDIVELGYLGGVPELHGSVSGISANIPPDLILECSKLGGAQSGLMIHPSSQVSPALISEAIDAGVDIFRVVYHPSWEKKFTDICEFLMGENRKFFINLALITHYKLEQIVLIANKARLLGAAGFYFADTCGALDPLSVKKLFSLVNGMDLEFGFHAHDGLSLALANSISAASYGARYIDCSLGGIGRGGGNLKLEQFCGFLFRNGIGEIDWVRLVLELCRRNDPQVVVYLICSIFNFPPPVESALIKKIEIEDWLGFKEIINGGK